MRDVDYVKLSELYASFLIAIGGVSITVLSIVSAIGSKTETTPAPNEEITRALELTSSFLSAALIVATVSCFIGAHMMAETAAFIKHFKERLPKVGPIEVNPRTWAPEEWPPSAAITFGKRLFLLATTNIFVSVILVLFAIVLLPAAKGTTRNVSLVYFIIFASVGGGALYWMYLASKFRMPVKENWKPIIIAGIAGLLWGLVFGLGIKSPIVSGIVIRFPIDEIGSIPLPTEDLLALTFTPIVLFIVATLIYFASIFKGGSQARRPRFIKARGLRYLKVGTKARNSEVSLVDIGFFGCAVTISYASLVVAGIKIIAAEMK